MAIPFTKKWRFERAVRDSLRSKIATATNGAGAPFSLDDDIHFRDALRLTEEGFELEVDYQPAEYDTRTSVGGYQENPLCIESTETYVTKPALLRIVRGKQF
jgi:hypothetical protein